MIDNHISGRFIFNHSSNDVLICLDLDEDAC